MTLYVYFPIRDTLSQSDVYTPRRLFVPLFFSPDNSQSKKHSPYHCFTGYALTKKQELSSRVSSFSISRSGCRQHDFVLLPPDKNSFNYRCLTRVIGL